MFDSSFMTAKGSLTSRQSQATIRMTREVILPILRRSITFVGEAPLRAMTLGEKLKKAREARALGVEQVARALGVSRKAVYQWEINETTPRMPKLRRLAEIYETDFAWLVTDNDSAPPAGLMESPVATYVPPPRPKAIPVINYVQAGEWTEVQEHADTPVLDRIYVDVKVGPRAFALEVEGLSMVPELLPGDKIVIDPDVPPGPGSIVVAHLDDEPRATVKRYRDRGRDESGQPIIELAPANPDYPTLRIDAAHPGRIVGVMVERRSYPTPTF